MGSVKDLVVLEEPKSDTPGRGRFIFSNRYSVFDWGEMPDHIEDKGKAICIATAYYFEELERRGIKTHYIGLVEDGRVKRLDELRSPSDTMEFRMVRVLKPAHKDGGYDYSIYKTEKRNFLIPLEVIFRNSLPEGSSVFKRFREGKLRPQDIGLDSIPAPNTVLNEPLIDFSTKLESTDRYLTYSEAREIAGMNENEFEELKKKTLEINRVITEKVKRLGMNNEDGKVEFAFDENRNLTLVDAVGTLDECRFTYSGLPVSKEIARIYYRKTEWYKDVESAKKISKIEWKKFVRSVPERLPERFAKGISMLYKSYANALTGRKWFDVPEMQKILDNIVEYLK